MANFKKVSILEDHDVVATSETQDSSSLPVQTVNGCWNCLKGIPAGLDEPEDHPFCVIDGHTLIENQTCEYWEAN